MGYEYYDYGYDAGSAVATGVGAALGILAFVYILALAVSIFTIVCNWKVFKKAGKKGWEAIVPIYNTIVLLEITNLPMWYIALFFIPVGNIIVMFLIYIELAKKFGQSAGFGVGLVFLNPIFMAILAFNKNYVYQGQVVMNNQPMYNQQPMNNQPVYNQQPMMNNQMNTMNQQQSPIMDQPVVAPVIDQTVVEPVQPQPAVNNNCSKCGAPVNPGDRFCMSCGNQL